MAPELPAILTVDAAVRDRLMRLAGAPPRMLEVALLVLLSVLGGVGFNLLRRSDAQPIAFWTWGGFCLLGAGIGTLLIPDLAAWAVPLGFSLAMGYSMLLLAGAISFAGRPRIRGLISAGLLVGRQSGRRRWARPRWIASGPRGCRETF